VKADDPCILCGANTICQNGVCICETDYHGDPYVGCKPECILNSDCDRDKACIRRKCVNPCAGLCGINAICEVLNHIPICRCPDGMSGNAFVKCNPIESNLFV
jgi:hypothetical protein